MFSTPHGTVIEVGLSHLSPITKDGLEQLIKYESELKIEQKKLYDGRLEVKDLE